MKGIKGVGTVQNWDVLMFGYFSGQQTSLKNGVNGRQSVMLHSFNTRTCHWKVIETLLILNVNVNKVSEMALVKYLNN